MGTEKVHKIEYNLLFNKNSEIVFIILPTFYLTLWLMTCPKNFEKIVILKI